MSVLHYFPSVLFKFKWIITFSSFYSTFLDFLTTVLMHCLQLKGIFLYVLFKAQNREVLSLGTYSLDLLLLKKPNVPNDVLLPTSSSSLFVGFLIWELLSVKYVLAWFVLVIKCSVLKSPHSSLEQSLCGLLKIKCFTGAHQQVSCSLDRQSMQYSWSVYWIHICNRTEQSIHVGVLTLVAMW